MPSARPTRRHRRKRLYLHIYNVVEWEGPLGLWASTGTVGALALTADGVDADATLALQYMTDDTGSWPSDLANGLAPLLAFAAFAAVLLFGLQCPAAADRGGGRPCVRTAVCARHPGARRAR